MAIPHPESTDSAAAFSIVQAAFQTILARASSANASPIPAPPSLQPTPSTPGPPLPGRKRKAGKSKLSQAWGPNDLVEVQDVASISATIPSSNSLPEPAASVPTISAQNTAPTKAAKAKKAPRPSTAPMCPICDKASLHPRSQCPVVDAGPAAIRKRIAQLKKSGNGELVEELEVLLKEAQRRRRSAGEKRTADITAAESVAAPDAVAEAPPSSPDMPLQSLPTSALSRPPLGDRSLSSPRLPAGSEISEVAVESKDEGSSNESSGDEEDEELAQATSFLQGLSSFPPDPTNLEALLYGPIKPRVSVLAQIPSSSESSADEESDDEAEKDDDVDMDEEDKNDRAFRRMSRKFARSGSSSDENEPQPEPDQLRDVDADTDVDDQIIPPTEMDPDPNNSIDTQVRRLCRRAVTWCSVL